MSEFDLLPDKLVALLFRFDVHPEYFLKPKEFLEVRWRVILLKFVNAVKTLDFCGFLGKVVGHAFAENCYFCGWVGFKWQVFEATCEQLSEHQSWEWLRILKWYVVLLRCKKYWGFISVLSVLDFVTKSA